MSTLYGTFGSRRFEFLPLHLRISSKLNYLKPKSKQRISNPTNRFVGFVGIDLKQMEMDCVQHVENPILKIQLTLSRCQKTSN